MGPLCLKLKVYDTITPKPLFSLQLQTIILNVILNIGAYVFKELLLLDIHIRNRLHHTFTYPDVALKCHFLSVEI